MAGKKRYEDDDGRTIADMSGLSPARPFLLPRKSPQAQSETVSKTPDRPWEPGEQLSKEDRRVYIFAALRAALLIAAVFIGGLGLATWLLLRLWS